jgi:hypothetical protein
MVDEGVTLSHLRRLFKGLAMPDVIHFTSCVLRSDGFLDHQSSISLPLSPWLGGSYDSLQIMDICCTVIPFDRHIFPSLRVLRVWGSHPLYSLSVTALLTVIANSPILRQLTVRRFTCHDLHVAGVPSIYSSTITTLEVGFSADGTIGQLVSSFVFPLLHHCLVDVSSQIDVHELLNLSPPLLLLVKHLSIRNPKVRPWPFSSSFTAFLPLFPALTTLDIRDSRSSVFVDLVDAVTVHSQSSPYLLVLHLITLVMNYGHLHAIRSFSTLYGVRNDSDGRHMVLQHIHAGSYGPSAAVNDALYLTPDYLWLSRHVADFRFDYLGTDNYIFLCTPLCWSQTPCSVVLGCRSAGRRDST